MEKKVNQVAGIYSNDGNRVLQICNEATKLK